MDSTMTICDSVTTCVNKTAEICQHCAKEAETNWLDVLIIGIICATIVIIVLNVTCRYLKLKNAELEAQQKVAENKRKNEIDDRKFKQKVDLQDKLLSFQKDCAEIKRDDHGNLCPKYKYEDSACKDYRNTLIKLINEEKLESNDKEAQIPPVEIR